MTVGWSERHQELTEALRELPRELYDPAASPDEQLHRVLVRTQDAPPQHQGPTKRIRGAALSLDDFPALSTLSSTDSLSRVELVRPSSALSGSQNGHASALYVMKTVDKRWAYRMREQQSHVHELAVLRLGRRDPETQRRIPRLVASFLSPASFHIVMSHAPGGDVWSVLEANNPPSDQLVSPKGLSETWVKSWFGELVDAVDWLHSSGWAHRDIKPHNMLLNADGHLLLTDFGSAAPLSQDGSSIARKYCRALVGTPDYIAPEILQHAEALYMDAIDSDDEDAVDGVESFSSSRKEDRSGQDDIRAYGAEVDWWSCGVVLYELLFGIAPFFAEGIPDTYDRIKRWTEFLDLPPSSAVSDAARDLIRSVLCDAGSRPSPASLKTHRFFSSIKWADLRFAPAPYRPRADLNAWPASPSLSRSQRSFARSFDVDSFMSSPGLSILRPSPRTQTRAQADERSYWEASHWGGLTTLPEANEFKQDLKEHQPAVGPAAVSNNKVPSFETPAKPRSSVSLGQAPASAIARRAVGGIEAWREMQEHAWSVGRSARKSSQAGSQPSRQRGQKRRYSDSRLGGLQQRQEDVAREIDNLTARYEKLFSLAATASPAAST